MIPSLDDILLFYHCEPIENAPLYSYCRFPNCIPRTERDVSTVFYAMPYVMIVKKNFMSKSLKLVTLGHCTVFVWLYQCQL
jgi:hypothetical protein